jgi:hypothetical protein
LPGYVACISVRLRSENVDLDTIRLAMVRANPKLSRFDPLSRIIYFDDFDEGIHGWTQLIGNYEGSLDRMLPEFRDLRPPMLSNLTQWDTGTNGALDGNYALKIATRAREGSMGVAIKRLTWRAKGLLQMEAYFAFKPEAAELQLSELDVRAVGFLMDLQDENARVMPHIRYLNALHGKHVGKWQFKRHREPIENIGTSGKTKSHFHLSNEGWEDVPNARQLLCYNEIPTKQNWHYFRVQFDLATMSFVQLQCNDRVHDVSGIEPMKLPAMANLWCMLNPVFFVETDVDKRAFLYVDSVVVSGEW